jgi:hypothetical protein
MASYPSGTDYAEALQNTRICFRAGDLRGGLVRTTPLGIPRAVSGNNASVFQVTGTGQRRFAVKCFTRHVPDQLTRYAAVIAGLRGLDRAWTVPVRYLTQGILVAGRWYPLVQMDWLDATSLIPWVEDHLGDPVGLAGMAEEFATMVGDLTTSGLAHGDLQHGNLLVDRSGRLRLIDYDGMYLPQLRSCGATESGHLNYQPPARTDRDYGPELDNFSAWLIYCSLLLLIVEPGLWELLHRPGDEQLLFGRRDFKQPLAALAVLGGTPGDAVRRIEDCLHASWTATSVPEVPAFDPTRLPAPRQLLAGLPTGVRQQAEIGSGARITAPAGAGAGDCSWQEFRAGSPPVDRSEPPVGRHGGYLGGASWVAGHLPAPAAVSVGGRPDVVRLGLVAIAVLAATLGLTAPGSRALSAGLAALACALFLTGCWAAYSTRPEVGAKRAAAAQARTHTAELAVIDRKLARLRAQLQAELAHRHRRLQWLAAEQARARDGESADLTRAAAELLRRRQELDAACRAARTGTAPASSLRLLEARLASVDLQLTIARGEVARRWHDKHLTLRTSQLALTQASVARTELLRAAIMTGEQARHTTLARQQLAERTASAYRQVTFRRYLLR